MNTYRVTVEQLQRQVYEVDATSEDEAMDKWMWDGSYVYEDAETPDISIELNGGEEASEEVV